MIQFIIYLNFSKDAFDHESTGRFHTINICACRHTTGALQIRYTQHAKRIVYRQHETL